MPARVTINRNALLASMTDGRNGIVVAKIVEEGFKNKVEEAQKEMVQAFEEDLITKELEGGVGASNISGTLGGRGNLFSFIGFEQGSDPTEVIRKLLTNKIKIQVKPQRRGKFKVEILAPTIEEIYKVTPIPWNPGRSWVDGIQKGISGLGSYVPVTSPYSRSGKGLQTNQDKGGRFANRSYMTTILKKFDKDLRK